MVLIERVDVDRSRAALPEKIGASPLFLLRASQRLWREVDRARVRVPVVATHR